jgi:hypothetical protein
LVKIDMKSISNNKSIIIAVFVFVLALFLYNTFIKPNQAIILDSTSAVSVGEDLLKMSADLNRVNLRTDILSDRGFLLLIDFTAPIAQDPLGRPNPFNPIGRD